MATKLDVSEFMTHEGVLAARVADDRLPGLLSRTLTIPEGAVALVRKGGADAVVIKGAAQQSASDLKGVLAKADPFAIDFRIEGLGSSDKLEVEASVRLSFAFRAEVFDLESFEKNLLGDREDYSRSDFEGYLLPYVRDALKAFVLARTAHDLCETDVRDALADLFAEEMKRPLFDGGIALRETLHPRFESEAYDELKRNEVEARIKAEEREQEQRLEELNKRLEAEGLIKELELRGEIDDKRHDQQLKRWEELQGKMGADETKALVFLLDDDDLRADLVKKLIERDLPDDEKAALKAREVEEKLTQQLREMQSKLAELSGVELADAQERGPQTRRLLAVVGKKILAFDPKTNLNPEVAKEVHDTEGGTLGYLRSVRFQRLRGQEVILAGAQRGVYWIEEGHDPKEFAFPKAPDGHGGANSICTFDDRVYASHSELGIVAWDVKGVVRSQTRWDDVTGKHSATRGACLGSDGKLYFSSGPNIYAADLVRGKTELTCYSGSTESITAFCVGRSGLYAGNKYGTILRWNLDDPRSPNELPVRKANPIYMLRLFEAGGENHLVVGSKDFSVTVATVGKDKFKEYRAREEVRWVDAASDYIFGVSRAGYKIFVWHPKRPAEPTLTIRVADKIQDVWVCRERRAEA